MMEPKDLYELNKRMIEIVKEAKPIVDAFYEKLEDVFVEGCMISIKSTMKASGIKKLPMYLVIDITLRNFDVIVKGTVTTPEFLSKVIYKTLIRCSKEGIFGND